MHELSDNFHDNYELFIQQVIFNGCVFALSNDDGFLLVGSEQFEHASVMPFWSDKAFAESLLEDDEELEGYAIVEIAIEGFVEEWLEGMHEDEYLVGPNWTEDFEGLELEPMIVADEFDKRLDQLEAEQ